MTVSTASLASSDETTTLCLAWLIEPKSGDPVGFTDHDENLFFDGYIFEPTNGFDAVALENTTGLAVDNTDVIGAIDDDKISETALRSGYFDQAIVSIWLVDWSNTKQRQLEFRGEIGDIQISGSNRFEAELRGLSAPLNRSIGRVYQAPCDAILGDARCQFGLDKAGYTQELVVSRQIDSRIFEFENCPNYDVGWFAHGSLKVIEGKALGQFGTIKTEAILPNHRRIELWTPLKGVIETGDKVLLSAGCDKRFDTCRHKFKNNINFQGFPDIPTQDWVVLHPNQSAKRDGGSRR